MQIKLPLINNPEHFLCVIQYADKLFFGKAAGKIITNEPVKLSTKQIPTQILQDRCIENSHQRVLQRYFLHTNKKNKKRDLICDT